MRSAYIVGLSTLLAAGPAMGQVIIQTPTPYQPGDQRADQERADARWAHEEAQRRAARGDYEGAAQAERQARRDWHDAQRQDYRSQEPQGGVVFGR